VPDGASSRSAQPSNLRTRDSEWTAWSDVGETRKMPLTWQNSSGHHGHVRVGYGCSRQVSVGDDLVLRVGVYAMPTALR
jgi:hypothetical protein